MKRADLFDERANRRALAGFLLMTLTAAGVWCVGWSAVCRNAPLAIAAAVLAALAFFAGSAAFERSRYWLKRSAEERGFETIETLPSPRWHGATTENDNNGN